MLFYFKIALRNLLKNYRRSVKTVLTIVIGLSACLLAQGFISHTLWGLRESLINGGLGHFQVYRQGYLQHGSREPYRYLISESVRIRRELQKLSGFKLAAPRLNFQGMVTAGDKSAIFVGTAGLPSQERILNSLSTLKAGSYLDDAKPFGIAIGTGIARKLKVGIGDMVTLTTTLPDGGVNALDVEVTGIIEVQVQAYNDVVLLAHLATVQDFLALPDAVEQINVLLERTENWEKTEPAVRRLCRKAGLEYRGWQQLVGVQYTQPRMFYNLLYVLMMSIIVMVVVFSIANTLNLTMHERVREIGTIRSLGTTRLQVAKIFITESFFIGVIGGLVGLIAGYGLATLLNALGGIPIPPPPGQARGYTAFFRPDFLQALELWLLFLITATVAGVYPAFKAARLQIVDALRWI